MNKEINQKIYVTKDYEQFKILEGNRNVDPSRIRKIIGSISNVGVISAPILVNEKLQIIDGQGRLQACKELGEPIYFTIVNGIGLKECKALNITASKWQLADFINSYAVEGNKNYIRLKKLIEQYPQFDLNALVGSCADQLTASNRDIKDGSFILTEEQYNIGIEKLEWLKPTIALKTKGSLKKLQAVMLYLYSIPEIDNERLMTAIMTKMDISPYWKDTISCVQAVDMMYNHKINTKNVVYITAEFDKKFRLKKQERLTNCIIGLANARETGEKKHKFNLK